MHFVKLISLTNRSVSTSESRTAIHRGSTSDNQRFCRLC